tara:strand:- start:198 stop:557 length:360 start_codon:yes stop_codon:yes gene_type:complete
MSQKLILSLLGSIGGLWIAIQFAPDVAFSGTIVQLLLAGGILGILNAILKPVLNLITFPIRILTMGLSSILLNALMVLIVDILFEDLAIVGIIALFWTTISVWGVTTLALRFQRRNPLQ